MMVGQCNIYMVLLANCIIDSGTEALAIKLVLTSKLQESGRELLRGNQVEAH